MKSMMKNGLLLLVLMASMPAMATILPSSRDCEANLAITFLRFKLTGEYYVNNKRHDLDVVKLNEKLKKRGLKSLPTELTIGVSNSKKIYEELVKSVEEAQEVLKFTIFGDGSYLDQMPEICYSGSPATVVRLIEKLQGSFFHQDMGIYAYRFGTVVKNLDPENLGSTDSEMRERFSDQESALDLWLNYNKTSSDVVILSNWGPQGDGTELLGTRIPRCPSF